MRLSPLNGQEVYILASDLSRNLCTPGPNGTYTWTTTITSLGNNTYNAAFFTTKYGEYIATRSNDVTIKFTKPTDIWLAVSNTHPKIWEQVTFTARLFQGNESIEKLLPLSDQSVYIINVADGSKNLCTPGPDGTYTWTWIPSPGRYAYHATFNGNDGYLASSSREVRFDFPTLTMHYEIHEEECQGSWLPVPDPRGLDCIYTVISLNGRLMDPDGTGIPGKTIQVYTNDLTQLVVTATTDANGNWEAPWIGVKQYNWPADTMTPWRSPPQAIAYFTGDNTYGEAWS